MRFRSPGFALLVGLSALFILPISWSSRCFASDFQSATADVVDSIIEVSFTRSEPAENPLRILPSVTLHTTAAEPRQVAVVDAFWDGGKTWRARFRVTEPGEYRYELVEADGEPAGLSGTIRVEQPAPKNALRVSENGTHLETLSGEPFFWLADTAWNGVLRSTAEQWATYLDTRKQQEFNVVQFVSTPWRGGRETLKNPPFDLSGGKLVSADPKSLAEMDAKVRQINDHGMLASPIMLWALTDEDPGEALSEDDAIQLARYLKARWGAYRVVWMLGGDGRYPDPARWQRIGEAVFPQSSREGMMPQLVTTHPSGLNWVGDDFAESDWLQFHGYQSGHGDGDSDLKRHLTGPWTEFPFDGQPRPVINLEPNYETHPAYQSGQPHSAQHVRRAAYWSILLGPAAGVTYGHNAIWVWNHEPGKVAENHGFKVDAWSAGLKSPGIRSMTIMKRFFESGPWWKLRSANELVADSNQDAPVAETVVAARATDQSWLVAYTPAGRTIVLAQDATAPGAQAIWFDPTSGEKKLARRDGHQHRPPTADQDWVLSIRED